MPNINLFNGFKQIKTVTCTGVSINPAYQKGKCAELRQVKRLCEKLVSMSFCSSSISASGVMTGFFF